MVLNRMCARRAILHLVLVQMVVVRRVKLVVGDVRARFQLREAQEAVAHDAPLRHRVPRPCSFRNKPAGRHPALQSWLCRSSGFTTKYVIFTLSLRRWNSWSISAGVTVIPSVTSWRNFFLQQPFRHHGFKFRHAHIRALLHLRGVLVHTHKRIADESRGNQLADAVGAFLSVTLMPACAPPSPALFQTPAVSGPAARTAAPTAAEFVHRARCAPVRSSRPPR